MTVTEEEAKEKWCPMAREAINPLKNISINRSDEGYGRSRCVASACMIWIWDTAEETKGYCGLVRKMSSKEVIYHGHDRRGNLQFKVVNADTQNAGTGPDAFGYKDLKCNTGGPNAIGYKALKCNPGIYSDKKMVMNDCTDLKEAI